MQLTHSPLFQNLFQNIFQKTSFDQHSTQAPLIYRGCAYGSQPPRSLALATWQGHYRGVALSVKAPAIAPIRSTSLTYRGRTYAVNV